MRALPTKGLAVLFHPGPSGLGAALLLPFGVCVIKSVPSVSLLLGSFPPPLSQPPQRILFSAQKLKEPGFLEPLGSACLLPHSPGFLQAFMNYLVQPISP